MPIWIRTISIISILVSGIGLVLYVSLETADLQKSMDMVTRLNVFVLGAVIALFGLFLIYLLYNNWLTSNIIVNVSMVVISIALLASSTVYYESVYHHKTRNKSIMVDYNK